MILRARLWRPEERCTRAPVSSDPRAWLRRSSNFATDPSSLPARHRFAGAAPRPFRGAFSIGSIIAAQTSEGSYNKNNARRRIRTWVAPFNVRRNARCAVMAFELYYATFASSRSRVCGFALVFAVSRGVSHFFCRFFTRSTVFFAYFSHPAVWLLHSIVQALA